MHEGTSAPGRGGSTTPSGLARPALYTAPLLLVCLVGLLGFASNMVIQPVLPVLVLEHGGDAGLVGLVIAAFSIPSVIARPYIGRLVDRWSHRRVLAGGLLGIAISGVVYIVPSLVVLFLNRVFHGGVWAGFTTAGHAMVARLAPPERRGEASGLYSLTPSIAQAVMPWVGVVLLTSVGTAAPFLVCAALGLAGFVLTVAGPLARATLPVLPPQSGSGASAPSGRLLSSGALLPMLVELLFSLPINLFLVFPPVWADLHGVPLEELALFYPIFGITMVAVRAVSGRFLDRAPRGRIIRLGAVLGAVGLAVAATSDTLAALTLGGAIYASAAAFTSPTVMALAIDRADPRRMGAAMATYTLGFQLALGAGAALWGVIIAQLGYPAPYVVAVVCQLGVIGLLALPSSRTLGGHPGVPRA